MKPCTALVVVIFAFVESARCDLYVSNFSCDKLDPNSEEHLSKCKAKSIKDSFKFTKYFQSKRSSEATDVDHIVALKIREQTCAKANEFIIENDCNNHRTDRSNDTMVDGKLFGSSAVYLYGWLAYRLVFILLQQM